MRFPIFALIAPILTSVVLWLVTGSAYTLLFALLGPVMALAQFADGKLQARKAERLAAEHEDEREAARRAELAQKSLFERKELLLKHPASSSYAFPTNSTRPPWAASAAPAGEQRLVRLGLHHRSGEPVLIDVGLGIAITGEQLEVRSVIRALGFQLLWHWGSSEFSRVQWNLPLEAELLEFQPEGISLQPISVHVWDAQDPLPAGVTYTLSTHQGKAVLRNVVDPAAQEETVIVDLLTRAESNRILSVVLQEQLALSSRAAPATIIPHHVPAVVNVEGDWESSRSSLLAFLGRDERHPLFVDIVSAGPHAVVTGMTGSGKTEFLRAWLISLMATYSPEHLSVVILDYKGGAGFSQLKQLPHVAGVLTDLDPASTHRAVTSLRAEIRYREEILAQAGVSDISLLPENILLPRLIVVVDEYRVMIEAFPELVSVFVDLSSRGRSLGIHLILSSQRTGGVVGDAILANCALRVSFRVSEKQDSHALLGSDSAATLEHIPGRAVVQGTGVKPRTFQSAFVENGTFLALLSRLDEWKSQNPAWNPHLPWQPALPHNLALGEMPESIEAVAWLGLCDLPEVQEQSWAPYTPASEGNLLITGPARSGVSTAVQAIHSQLGGLLLTDSEIAWDAIVEQPSSLFHSTGLVLIEDLEELVGRYDIEHREHFITCLLRIVRSAPQKHAAVIVGCGTHIRGVQNLLDQFTCQLTLTSPDTPGRGQWRGHEIQLVHIPVTPELSGHWEELSCDEDRSYALITHRVLALLPRLEKTYGQRVCRLGAELQLNPHAGNVIVVGTPDEWMMNSQKLAAMRSSGTLVLDGCSPSEVRGLRLRPGLMPHCENDTALVVEPDGSITRAVLEA